MGVSVDWGWLVGVRYTGLVGGCICRLGWLVGVSVDWGWLVGVSVDWAGWWVYL